MDSPVAQLSRVEFTVVISGAEVTKALLALGGVHRFFPWPSDAVRADENAHAVWDRIKALREVPLSAYMGANAGSNPSWEQDPVPTMRAFETLRDGDRIAVLRVDVDTANNRVTPIGATMVSRNQETGFGLLHLMVGRIYKFDPERFRTGRCAFGASTELAPDARNLPEVLGALQGSNPHKWEDFVRSVVKVFPAIKGVSVRPSLEVPGQQEIVVWQVAPASRRADLAVPLWRSGTGVGQVLAMLYVVHTSDQPRTIVIDEPGSFLHPGAARALISILAEAKPRHQYIVATHSPEIINELEEAPITIVRWDGSKSTVEQFPRATSGIVATALTEIGTRLSDVYGYDSVLWLEGASDAGALKAALGLAGKLNRRTAVLAVRDPNAFRKRSMAEVIAIYRALSDGDSLRPPALAFLFDREGRSDTEIADLVREGAGKVRFLERRMLENYLLNIKAIAALFNEEANKHGGQNKLEADVEHWINTNGHSFHSPPSPAVFSEDWIRGVHAASLLERLFIELSQSQLTYRKTVHTPRLTELTYEHDRNSVELVIGIIADVLA